MARYSDSDDDRKKHKKKKKHRSRSRSVDSSSSYDSHYRKKSKSKKKRKRKSRSPSTVSHSSSRRSRSRDRSSRRSRSPSRSRDQSRDRDYDRYQDKKSRDRDRSKERDRSHRSRSRERKSDYRSKRSRSRSRGSRRSRSGSRSRVRRSRSRDRSHSSKRYEKSSYRSMKSASPEIKQEVKETKKDDPCAKIPGFAEMEPSEQAKIRLKMALQAAAAADEQLRKMQEQSSLALDQRSVKDQPNFADKVESIESAGFTQSTFQSGFVPGRAKQQKVLSEEKSHDDAIFGVHSNIKQEDKISTDSLEEKIPSNIDIDMYAHPSLFVDVNEKKKRWIQKLCAFRKKRLTGVILS